MHFSSFNEVVTVGGLNYSLTVPAPITVTAEQPDVHRGVHGSEFSQMLSLPVSSFFYMHSFMQLCSKLDFSVSVEFSPGLGEIHERLGTCPPQH